MRLKLEKEPMLFKIIPWFIGIVFGLIVLFWIGFAFVAVKVGGEVSEHGLKAAIERLWCGAGGCK